MTLSDADPQELCVQPQGVLPTREPMLMISWGGAWDHCRFPELVGLVTFLCSQVLGAPSSIEKGIFPFTYTRHISKDSVPFLHSACPTWQLGSCKDVLVQSVSHIRRQGCDRRQELPLRSGVPAEPCPGFFTWHPGASTPGTGSSYMAPHPRHVTCSPRQWTAVGSTITVSFFCLRVCSHIYLFH